MIAPNVLFLTWSMIFNVSIQTVISLLRSIASIFNFGNSLNKETRNIAIVVTVIPIVPYFRR